MKLIAQVVWCPEFVHPWSAS